MANLVRFGCELLAFENRAADCHDTRSVFRLKVQVFTTQSKQLCRSSSGSSGQCIQGAMHLILRLVNNGDHLLFLEAGRLLLNVRNWLDLLPLDEPRLEGSRS